MSVMAVKELSRQIIFQIIITGMQLIMKYISYCSACIVHWCVHMCVIINALQYYRIVKSWKLKN